jgi:hypothetical protein
MALIAGAGISRPASLSVSAHTGGIKRMRLRDCEAGAVVPGAAARRGSADVRQSVVRGPPGDGRGILQRCFELRLDGGETFGIAGEKLLDRERLSAFALLQRTQAGTRFCCRGSSLAPPPVRSCRRIVNGQPRTTTLPFEKQASPFLRTRHQRPRPAQTFATGRPPCQKASRLLAIRLNNLSAAHPPPSRRRGNRSCRRA